MSVMPKGCPLAIHFSDSSTDSVPPRTNYWRWRKVIGLNILDFEIYRQKKRIFAKNINSNMIIERKHYTDRLLASMHNGMVKVITGVRRSIAV